MEHNFFDNIKYAVTIVGLLVVLSACKKEPVEPVINNGLQQWAVNLGSDTTLPFFPDAKSNYISYSFKRKSSDNFVIKLTGTFPNARYMSMVIYDNKTRNPVGVIRDVDIIPSTGHQNPYVQRTYVADQQFELFIAPENNDVSAYNNTLAYPDSLTSISVFIRLYLPRENDFGGTNLPGLQTINTKGLEIPPPTMEDLKNSINRDEIISRINSLREVLFRVELPGERYFFRPSGNTSGNFANPDNEYLLSPITLGQDEVVLIRWLAPNVATDFTDFSTVDMRYYSISLCNPGSYNFLTFSDEELYVANDGYINLVVGRPDSTVVLKSAGLNFMEWPKEMDEVGLLLYRNMLTKEGVSMNINQCKPISENLLAILLNPSSFDAIQFMGNYAPVGKKMSKTQFITDFGGMIVSY